MQAKPERQAALLKLIRKQSAASQSEIVEELQVRGFSATQASISRDLRELGLVKIDGHYRMLDRAAAANTAPSDPLNELITAVEPVGANLIIVRTKPGAASAIAAVIDNQSAADVAGTIAGDDTIFIAVRSRSAQGRAIAALRRPQGVSRSG